MTRLHHGLHDHLISQRLVLLCGLGKAYRAGDDGRKVKGEEFNERMTFQNANKVK